MASIITDDRITLVAINPELDESSYDHYLTEISSGCSLTKLSEIFGLVSRSEPSETTYRLLSLALIRHLQDHRTVDSWQWDSNSTAQCLSTLIEQPHVDTSPPVFLYEICSHFSSGQAWLLRAVADIFGSIIKSKIQSDADNFSHGYLLALLVVRQYLPFAREQWVTDTHHKVFPTLSSEELSLPYSNMFQAGAYQINVEELYYFYEQPEIINGLLPEHLLTIEWAIVDLECPWPATTLFEYLNKSTSDPDTTEASIAAARSLAVKYSQRSPRDAELALRFLTQLADRTKTAENAVALVKKPGEPLPDSIASTSSDKLTTILSSNQQKVRSLINLSASKAPFVPSFGRKPKIAVCVSGQLRGYTRVLPSWERNLLRNTSYDIFVHSWTSVGGSGAEPFREVLPFEGEAFQDAYRQCCLAVGFEEFKLSYPNLFHGLENSRVVMADEIKAFYKAKAVILEDDQESKFDAFTNSEKMHYKIYSANEMVRRSGEEYDLVLRIRPDLPISLRGFSWSDMVSACRDNRVLFADLAGGLHYMHCMIGDQIALGSQAALDTYASCYTEYPKIKDAGLFGAPLEFKGHLSLAYNCWLNNSSVHKLPVKKRALLDSEKMSVEKIIQALEKDSEGRNSTSDLKLLDACRA